MPTAVKHLHFSEPISSFSKLFSSIKPVPTPRSGSAPGTPQSSKHLDKTKKCINHLFSSIFVSHSGLCGSTLFSIFHLQHSDLSSAGAQFLMTTSCSSMASSSSVRLANIFPMSLRTSLVPSGETLPKV